MQQIYGRLRMPGTCTIFTTITQLNFIVRNSGSDSAREMAQVIIDSRTKRSLALDCCNVCDGLDKISIGEACIGAKPTLGAGSTGFVFQIEELRRFCHSLQLQVCELHVDGACTFCNIVGNQDPYSHTNSLCPWIKKTCNKCFQTGHNRNHCENEARKLPHGFCVMCLMPVNSVYGLHSGRYGMECTSELRDCLKPIVTLLFYSQNLQIMLDAANMLWTPSNPKPQTFSEYWNWLWLETEDHIYGILKVLNAVVRAVNCQKLTP